MTTLLIKNAYIVTMDDRQREIPEGGLFMRDGFIEQVGAAEELPQSADEVLDLKGLCRSARPHQHASSLLSNPHARRACRAGCQSLQLAQNFISDLGAHERR